MRFESIEEFEIIRPEGGGGTAFGIILDYARDRMPEPPASVIILTDGYATFPNESVAMDIPALWLINNGKVDPP